MLLVRGGGEPLGAVRAIAEALDACALDCQTGEAIDFNAADAEESFAAWRRFCDAVVSRDRT